MGEADGVVALEVFGLQLGREDAGAHRAADRAAQAEIFFGYMHADSGVLEAIEHRVHVVRVGPVILRVMTVHGKEIRLDALASQPGDGVEALELHFVADFRRGHAGHPEIHAIGQAKLHVGILGLEQLPRRGHILHHEFFIDHLEIFNACVVAVAHSEAMAFEFRLHLGIDGAEGEAGGAAGAAHTRDPLGPHATEMMEFHCDIVLGAVVHIFIEVAPVIDAPFGFDLSPFAGVGDQGAVEDFGHFFQFDRADLGGFVVAVGGVEIGGFEETQRRAEDKRLLRLIELHGQLLQGAAGGVHEMDRHIGLAVSFDVLLDGGGHEVFHGVPGCGVDHAGQRLWRRPLESAARRRYRSHRNTPIPAAALIGRRRGQKYVVSAVFFGQVDHGLVGQGGEFRGITAADQALAIVREGEAGFDGGDAGEPFGAELGGKIKLRAVAPIGYQRALGLDTEIRKPGGGQE